MSSEARYCGYLESPIGWIEIIGSEKSILSVDYVDEPQEQSTESALVNMALEQLSEYFQDTRKIFDLRLCLAGTDFQRKVWNHVLQIPFGQVATYHEVADRIGKPKAVRAVGAANGRNPISIIVPCHRVIGSDGSLTGYGGGLWRKKWLLEHEDFLAK